MKVAHVDKHFSAPKTGQDYLEMGKQREADGDLEGAIAMYQKMINKHYQKEFGYQRLMILLRGLKDYKKELTVINQAIDDFKKLYSRRNPLTNKKVITTSKKLIRLMGLGKDDSHYPQPIQRWLKRKEGLKKRMTSR
jgi:tetratricopeptide (TPR) repeat protein